MAPKMSSLAERSSRPGCPGERQAELIFVIEPEDEAVAVDFQFRGNPGEGKMRFRSHGPTIFKTAEQLLREPHGHAAAHLVSGRPVIAAGPESALINIDHAEAGTDIRLHAPHTVGEF